MENQRTYMHNQWIKATSSQSFVIDPINELLSTCSKNISPYIPSGASMVIAAFGFSRFIKRLARNWISIGLFLNIFMRLVWYELWLIWDEVLALQLVSSSTYIIKAFVNKIVQVTSQKKSISNIKND